MIAWILSSEGWKLGFNYCISFRLQGRDDWSSSDAAFVFRQCLISRLYIFLIEVPSAVLFNNLIKIDSESISFLDGAVRKSLSGFSRWDAVHFLHIAEYGYTFENSLAFFPLFPFSIYFLTRLWCWFTPFLSFSTALLTTAVCFNLVAFLTGGQLLYIMLLRLSASRKTALIGCIVFSLNPSSIFFSASYSESLFFALTLAGMLMLYDDSTSSAIRYYISACLFALAFLTRSNGLLNIGYIGFRLLQDMMYYSDGEKYLWDESKADFVSKSLSWYYPSKSYCSLSRSFFNPLPVFYAPIQMKYWNVGFLQYWRWIKLPCFLLALPALIIVAVLRVLRDRYTVLPFLLHALFLSLSGFFVYNVEVTTRILFSSSPFMYLILAKFMDLKTPNITTDETKLPKGLPFLITFRKMGLLNRLLLCYLLGYFLIGSALHINWLPFV
ncbi:unnamed protein product [Enterobius vermicularis]|uniref:GPI mannosyltransferase 2 n=1 Tax=Enterobius vermicularis TaxID=51028 RepID=A0A3P6IGR9_ENTVE|nr:unnamed protein product [Enterobius vermicularis]